MHQKIMVTRPFLPEREKFDRYVDEIWENRWLTNQGPIHERFKQELQKYLGVENITPTVNGHIALEVALRGLRIHGEVITTPFTFASTTHSISLCGMTPVFCDIRESDMTIDPDKIEELITDKTEAIVPVHVYGHPCDIEKIEKIAIKHNLKVLYDAAHAFGVKKNGECLALYGDASIFSFHATKLFNSIEGGAIVFKDQRYSKNFDMFKNFGIEDEENIPFVGGNGKMNEFQAAMGLANLEYMPEIIQSRKEYTLHYRKRLASIRGIRTFAPDSDPNTEYNYAYFPVLITEDARMNRDEVYDELKKANIFARKYFFPLISECACYRNVVSGRNLPVATKIAQQVMTLPLYADLGHDNVDYICDQLEHILGRK